MYKRQVQEKVDSRCVNKSSLFLNSEASFILPDVELHKSADEPPHIGAQRGAGSEIPTQREEDLKQTIKRQEKMIKFLAEQQNLILTQLAKNPEKKTTGTEDVIKNSWVAGPAPIRLQKMTAEDDPEAYLNTFERVALAAGWPKEQWTLILTPCLSGNLQEIIDTLSPVSYTHLTLPTKA